MTSARPSSPTLRDIAKACGVSHTLVSRALRNHPHVSAPKRELVLRTAKKLGHRPDPLVSILLSQVRQRRNRRFQATLAWVNTNALEDWWRRTDYERGYLEGARARAADLGYALDEFWLNPQGFTPQTLARTLRARNIYGLILPFPRESALSPDFPWDDFAISVIGWLGLETCPWSRIACDFNGNLGLALAQIESRGYRRIGLCCPDSYDALANHMVTGRFLSWQRTVPARQRVPLHIPAGNPGQTVLEFGNWLRRHTPDAIIYTDARVLPVLKSLHWRVPEDVGLVHLNLGPDVHSWAGVDQQIAEMGAAAIDLVTAQLQRNERGRPFSPKCVLMPGRWRDGRTLAVKPQAHPLIEPIVSKGKSKASRPTTKSASKTGSL